MKLIMSDSVFFDYDQVTILICFIDTIIIRCKNENEKKNYDNRAILLYNESYIYYYNNRDCVHENNKCTTTFKYGEM